jgi:hypothetical protein
MGDAFIRSGTVYSFGKDREICLFGVANKVSYMLSDRRIIDRVLTQDAVDFVRDSKFREFSGVEERDDEVQVDHFPAGIVPLSLFWDRQTTAKRFLFHRFGWRQLGYVLRRLIHEAP